MKRSEKWFEKKFGKETNLIFIDTKDAKKFICMGYEAGEKHE